MPTRNYKKDLIKRLSAPRYAAKYLKAAFEDGDEPEFLVALRNVVEAHGGISAVASESDVTRQHLHRILSKQGNPTLSTLKSVLRAVGVKIDFSVEKLRAA